MRTTSSPLAALGIAAFVISTLAGCSSGPDETATGGSNTSATTREKAVNFATCMREQGVTEFPDPDASGALTIDEVANGSSVDTDSPSFEKAMSACKNLQPPGFTGQKRNAKAQKAALLFAQCIRDHGVKDFPDPVAGEPLVDTNRIPSANEKGGMSILNAAMQACGKVYSGQLGVKAP